VEVNDVFPWPKLKYLRSVYLTDRVDHPARIWFSKGTRQVALDRGEIRVLPQPKHPEFGKYVLTPREVRKLLAEKGWNAVVAFQTRNHCTGLTSMRSSSDWRRCCARASTRVPC